MTKLGLSKNALIRARQRAIDANWLHYKAGRKGVPGRFWITTPPAAQRIDDLLPDGDESELQFQIGTESETDTAPESELLFQSETKSEPKTNRIRVPFIRIPKPTPNKEPPPKGGKGKKPKRQISIEDVTFPVELDLPAVRQSLTEWLDHKMAKGSPYKTTVGVIKLLGQFIEAGPTAFVATVNNSITQNYQGVGPPGQKNDRRNGQPPGPGQRYDPTSASKPARW
jgi:hypothetical protein